MLSSYKTRYATCCQKLIHNNDILRNKEYQKVIAVVAIGFSATFDTNDHKIRLEVLEKRYKITGRAMAWFKSYLNKVSKYQLARYRPLLDHIPQGVNMIAFTYEHTLKHTFTQSTPNEENNTIN